MNTDRILGLALSAPASLSIQRWDGVTQARCPACSHPLVAVQGPRGPAYRCACGTKTAKAA